MIFRANCHGRVPLKVLPTSCFRYNLDENSTKFRILKMKLYKIDRSFPYKFYNKIFSGFQENGWSLYIFCHEKFTHSYQSFTIYISYLIVQWLAMVTNEASIACKCFKKGNVGEYSL